MKTRNILWAVALTIACNQGAPPTSPAENAETFGHGVMIEYSVTIGRIAERLTTSQFIHLMPANTEFAPLDGWVDVVQRLPLGSSHVLYVFDMQSWPKSMWPGAPTPGPRTPGGLIQGHDDGPDPDCIIEDYYSKTKLNQIRAWRSYRNCMSEQAVEQCGHEVDTEFSTHFFFDDADTYHWDVHGHVNCNEEVD